MLCSWIVLTHCFTLLGWLRYRVRSEPVAGVSPFHDFPDRMV